MCTGPIPIMLDGKQDVLSIDYTFRRIIFSCNQADNSQQNSIYFML